MPWLWKACELDWRFGAQIKKTAEEKLKVDRARYKEHVEELQQKLGVDPGKLVEASSLCDEGGSGGWAQESDADSFDSAVPVAAVVQGVGSLMKSLWS